MSDEPKARRKNISTQDAYNAIMEASADAALGMALILYPDDEGLTIARMLGPGGDRHPMATGYSPREVIAWLAGLRARETTS